MRESERLERYVAECENTPISRVLRETQYQLERAPEVFTAMSDEDFAQYRAALDWHDGPQRAMGLLFLGASRDPRAFPELMRRLEQPGSTGHDPMAGDRWFSFWRRCLPYLRRMDRENREMQQLLDLRTAAQALGTLGDPRAVEPLRRLLATDPRPEVRVAVGGALKKLDAGTG